MEELRKIQEKGGEAPQTFIDKIWLSRLYTQMCEHTTSANCVAHFLYRNNMLTYNPFVTHDEDLFLDLAEKNPDNIIQ